jgi:hypothetical protein
VCETVLQGQAKREGGRQTCRRDRDREKTILIHNLSCARNVVGCRRMEEARTRGLGGGGGLLMGGRLLGGWERKFCCYAGGKLVQGNR